METASTSAVLLLNLPQGALGGIDLLSFTTTPRFQGIKNLPPGFHFVFTGSTSTLSIRHGFWILVEPAASVKPQLFVKKWDASTEELISEASEPELLRWRANLGSIWRDDLTPYRQTASSGEEVAETNDWTQLSDCITPALLDRILGDSWTLTSTSSAKQDIEEIPGLSAEESRIAADKDLHFLPIDLKQTWRIGATGRERTEAAQDRSWALTELTKTQPHNPSDEKEEDDQYTPLLGELQFTFLTILTLNNYSSLSQWRRILTLILTSKRLILTQPWFFVRALETLRLQLQHSHSAVEGGLFDFEDESSTWLKQLLLKFGRNLEQLPSLSNTGDGSGSGTGNSSNDDTQAVLDALDSLQDFLTETHGWQFDGIGGGFGGLGGSGSGSGSGGGISGSSSSILRTGILELEDGEQVEMDVTAFDEEDEQGEYAPQMVDLSAEQMEMLGLPVPRETSSLADDNSGGDGGGDKKAAAAAVEKALPHRAKTREIVQEVESDESGDEILEAWDPEDMDARY